MMFLLTCDKELTKSQLSPTHASTKRKITGELKHNAGWYEVREGSPVEVRNKTDTASDAVVGGMDVSQIEHRSAQCALIRLFFGSTFRPQSVYSRGFAGSSVV